MMVTILENELEFSGSKAEQELARKIYEILAARGRFMAMNTPVAARTDDLVELFANDNKRINAEKIAALVELNQGVLGMIEKDGESFVVTTRLGRTPVESHVDTSHSFASRLTTPEPKPEHPVVPLRPRSRGDARWSTLDRALAEYDLNEFQPLDESAVFETGAKTEIEEAVSVQEVAAEPAIEEVAAEPIIVAEDEQLHSLADAEIGPLTAAVEEALAADTRLATFAGEWMIEDRVPRLSRGDIRKIKDYVDEQDQPLTDDVLVQDVLEVRPKASDFALSRFGLNYRLGKEHREFEFVGTTDQRFWTMGSVTPIGTDRRKANDIGTDYRFQLEEFPEQPAYRSVSQVSHLLTFYEFNLGLLPYDPELQALMPRPLMDGQRTAVLTFECPQSYTTYLVELRYPTHNRGGFILGLDDFYNENLVPGATLTISASENDGHYVVEFEEAETQSQRLLDVGDRRQKYAFRPTSFNCAVFNEYLVDEDRFPGFAGDKPMDEKARRKIDNVIAEAFVRRNSKIEAGGYRALFIELFTAANVERPVSEAVLRKTLDEDQTGAFAKDPDHEDGYTYVPVGS